MLYVQGVRSVGLICGFKDDVSSQSKFDDDRKLKILIVRIENLVSSSSIHSKI